MGASYTKTQTARASVRQTRATQLAQAVEREARIEKAATAAVLAWQARQQAAKRLATADEHVGAKLLGLVVEKLSVNEIATLTGIPQRSCRLLIRALPQHVPAAVGGQGLRLEGGGSKVQVDGDGQRAHATVVDG